MSTQDLDYLLICYVERTRNGRVFVHTNGRRVPTGSTFDPAASSHTFLIYRATPTDPMIDGAFSQLVDAVSRLGMEPSPAAKRAVIDTLKQYASHTDKQASEFVENVLAAVQEAKEH